MNKNLFLQLKRIIAGIAAVGNSFLLREVFDMLIFEIRYWSEYSMSYALRYLFGTIVCIITIVLLVDYIIDTTREIRLEQDLQAENEYKKNIKILSNQTKSNIEKDETSIDPEELKEMIQNDYSNQSKTSSK